MKKIKWGVIGTGNISENRTIPGIIGSGNGQMEAIMGVEICALERVGEKFGINKRYTNLDDFLADSEIDAVYIASPLMFHYDQIKNVAASGKNVFVEKPMTLNYAQAENAVKACRDYGVKASVAFMLRYHEIHQKMRDIVKRGELGDIVGGYITMSFWYPEDGSWRQSKKTGGGGSLMDVGVHCFDVVQYVTGMRTEAVSATCSRQVFSYEVEDSAAVTLHLQNGALFQVQNYFCTPIVPSVFWVYGTKGSMCAVNTMDQTGEGTLHCWFSESDGIIRTYSEQASGEKSLYTLEVEAFADAVIYNTGESIPMEEGVFIQRIVEAAYTSSETRKVISIV